MNTDHIAQAVVAALRGESGLTDLLALHPDDNTRPALFEGTKASAPPVYPCVTYRLPDYVPDPRFRPTQAEGGGESPISDQILECEVWSKAGNSAVRAIGDQVALILEGQRLEMTAGAIHQAEMTIRINDQYDPGMKCFFALLRFRLRLDTSS